MKNRSLKTLFILSALTCLIWGSHIAIAGMKTQKSVDYDYELPSHVNRALERLSLDIKQAESLTGYESDRLVLTFANDETKTYSFAYGVLWCNDFPLINGLSSFGFECRGQHGHLLTPRQSDVCIKRIGYTLGLEKRGKVIFANQSHPVVHLSIPDSNPVLAMMQ